MNKIKRVSLFFRVLFQTFFILPLLVQIFVWIKAPESLKTALMWFDGIPSGYQGLVPPTLSVETKLMGFFVSVVPTLALLFILYSLIKLLKLYERGEIFSLNNARYIRNTGYALLVSQLFNPISQFLLGFILTRNNPPGQRVALVTISGMDIGIIFTGLIILLVSWVMEEGSKLREEQQLTI